MKYLLVHQKAADVDMRKARRMKAKGVRWELKIRGLAFDEVLKLATMDIVGKLVMSPEKAARATG
jgi:hypothetical protein